MGKAAMVHDNADQERLLGNVCGGLVPLIPALSSRSHKFEASLLCIAITNEKCLKKIGLSAILNNLVLGRGTVPKSSMPDFAHPISNSCFRLYQGLFGSYLLSPLPPHARGQASS